MARFDLPNNDPRLRKEFKKESPRAATSGIRNSPVKAATGKARSPFEDTGKVNAKKRQVLRDSKGRTYVRQGEKKVYVKKLFTPK
jgi:hypothetical protein